MVWNHRVVKTLHKWPHGKEEIQYAIHETYYPKTGAKPDSITCDPIVIVSEDVEGLRWVIEQCLKALDAPVLNHEDF